MAKNSKEFKKLKKTLQYITEEKIDIGKDLLSKLSFMDTMLEDLKEDIKKYGTTIIVKNGKQEFIKDNPAIKNYNTVIQRYLTASKQFVALLPKEEQAKGEDALMAFVAKGLK